MVLFTLSSFTPLHVLAALQTSLLLVIYPSSFFTLQYKNHLADEQFASHCFIGSTVFFLKDCTTSDSLWKILQPRLYAWKTMFRVMFFRLIARTTRFCNFVLEVRRFPSSVNGKRRLEEGLRFPSISISDQSFFLEGKY